MRIDKGVEVWNKTGPGEDDEEAVPVSVEVSYRLGELDRTGRPWIFIESVKDVETGEEVAERVVSFAVITNAILEQGGFEPYPPDEFDDIGEK